MAVTIGFLVAVTSNVAPAFSTAYNFKTWQTGLCFISAFIGSLIAIFFGGRVTDMVADWFTRRNGGVREPEMRLPAIAMSVISAPLSLILYGMGIQYQWHWIVPTIGLGLCKLEAGFLLVTLTWILVNFSIVQATNVSLVYTSESPHPYFVSEPSKPLKNTNYDLVDCYRPIAGEITLTQMAFKCRLLPSSLLRVHHSNDPPNRMTDNMAAAFGFLLSFYTNPWIAKVGYSNAYGTMAGISAAVLLFSIPLYFLGKNIRSTTAKWKMMKFVQWHLDRDTD
jgi:hypothetical protein